MTEEIEENNESIIISEELMSLYEEIETINSTLIDIAKSLRILSKRPNLEEEPIELPPDDEDLE